MFPKMLSNTRVCFLLGMISLFGATCIRAAEESPSLVESQPVADITLDSSPAYDAINIRKTALLIVNRHKALVSI